MDIRNNRSMSYDSSKILLQYLEANVRFQLSNRAPSIRKREKLVSLKINTLEFYPFEFVVNKTRYKMGTYHDYPTGTEALRGHQIENLKGGVPYDLDGYGFRDFSERDVVTPGDVVIKDPFHVDRNPHNDVGAEIIEKELKVYKWILAKRSGQQMAPLDDNLVFMVDLLQIMLSDELLRDKIFEMETTLAPFRCRRSGLQRPYTTSVQLTVISPNGTSQIWRKPSVDQGQRTEVKLHDVQKQLANFLFGSRTIIVCVKNFEVRSDDLHRLMIVRLPPNFRIKIESLTLGSNAPAICDAIQDLVHESSYPLRKFMYTSSARLLVHPTIAGARQLFFAHYYFNGIQEFLSFRNHIIYMGLNRFTSDEHITLLRNWIENRREIGASFTSLFKEEAIILNIFAQAKEHLNGFNIRERCIRIPMNDLLHIKVFYKHLMERADPFAKWTLIIKVVAV